MKGKKIFAITLVMILLINVFLTSFSTVFAAGSEPFTLNNKLYKAVKRALKAKPEITSAVYNDVNLSVSLSSEDLAKITELKLANSGIQDLSGIENFQYLERLELSQNDLSEESNLNALNSLENLKYLDISSNHIASILDIKDLADRLIATDSLIIGGQKCNVVQEYERKTGLGADSEVTHSFDLPQILSYLGFSKAEWKSIYINYEVPNSTPTIIKYDNDALNLEKDVPEIYNNDHLSINTEGTSITQNGQVVLNVGKRERDSEGYVTVSEYSGLLKLTLEIVDGNPEVSQYNNLNLAPENLLYDSVFNLCFVVHSDVTDVITVKDDNLYRALKLQLTAGQTKNKDLSTYKYSVDESGEIAYANYSYEVIPGSRYVKLRYVRSIDGLYTYFYNLNNKSLYLYPYLVEDLAGTSYKVVKEGGVAKYFYNPDAATGKVYAYDDSATTDAEIEAITQQYVIDDLIGKLQKVSRTVEVVDVENDNNGDISHVRQYRMPMEKVCLTDGYTASGANSFYNTMSLAEDAALNDVFSSSYSIMSRYDKQIFGKFNIYSIDGTNYINTDANSYLYVPSIFEKNGSVDVAIESLEPKKIATNLYEAAYDDARTFVISDIVLMNDIQTLILNNKEIRDLSGIEGFFGLKDKLNVSHNYLENIDEIDDIVAAKNARTASLLSKYSGLLREGDSYFSAGSEKYNSLKSAYDANVGFKSEFNSINDSIKSDTDSLREAFITYALTEAQAPANGEDEQQATARVQGEALSRLEEAFNNVSNKWIPSTGEGEESYSEKISKINSKVSGATAAMYHFLDSMYYYYKDEYKLTTLLSPNINYQDILEYEAYDEVAGEDANIIESEIKPLIEDEYSYLKTLESNNALSTLDKELLKAFFGVDYNSKADGADAPLAYVLDRDLEGMTANGCYNRLDTIRRIALYSEMANYCLIKRISDDDSKCYDIEYLYKKIDELETNQIPHDFEDKVLEAFIAGNSNPLETTKDRRAFEIYKAYADRVYVFKDSSDNEVTVSACGDAFDDGTDSSYKQFVKFNFINSSFDKTGLISEINSKKVSGKSYVINDALLTEKLDYYFDSYTKASLKLADEISGGYVSSSTVGSNPTYDNLDISTETDDRSESDRLFLYDQLMSLASKLINGNVDRYIKMPDLVELDISYNAELSDISNITNMPKLAKLNAAYDYIADVDEVDWEAMTSLRSLNLNYNFIRDITPILKLKKLRELYLSNNLIDNLPITADGYKETFKYMEDLDLSGNKLTDIEPMLQYLDFIRAGNYGDYLATHEDAVKINLHNQKIEITVAEPILLSEHPVYFDYELPKIFSQLEAIDIERTAFGTSSDYGRIESEGRYVTLPTYTSGTKTGIVTVIPMSGDGSEVTDCIGNGTTATIHYTVVGTAPNPDNPDNPDNPGGDDTQKTVTYSPTTNVSVKKGSSLQFNATVDGTINNSVPEWDVEGETSSDTKIENGLLTIGEDEEAETLQVKVTEKHTTPEGKTTTIDVRVLAADSEEEPTKTVIYNPTGTITMDKGSTQQIDATVDGTIDNTVPTWSISGNTSANTKVENGLVTIGEDETAATITVTATESYSTGEPVTTTFTIKVNGNEETPDQPTKKVTAIVVSPETANVRVGNSQTFTVSVEGENLEAGDKDLMASFSGKMSTATTLSSDGAGKLVLSVAEDETATELTIVLTSKFDNTVTKTIRINVIKNGTDDNPEANIDLGYDIVDGTNLTSIAPKTPLADFKSILLNGNNNYNVVVRKDGTVVEPTYIASGMTIEIQDKDGNAVKDKDGNLYVYDTVVLGDCNGDGVADSLDSKIIKAYKNETENLAEPFKRAADIDGNGTINLKDARLLLYHRAEVSGFVLNYTK